MEYSFKDWLICGECGERDGLSALSHSTEIVFECYGCGLVSEFEIGEDIPLQNFDVDAIVEAEKRKTDD